MCFTEKKKPKRKLVYEVLKRKKKPNRRLTHKIKINVFTKNELLLNDLKPFMLYLDV